MAPESTNHAIEIEVDPDNDSTSKDMEEEDAQPLLKSPTDPAKDAKSHTILGIDLSHLENPVFAVQAAQLTLCFFGLQASYLTWGYMQELIMTSKFDPTDNVPDGRFPSAAFCVFSNRFLAVIVAMIAVKMKHGTVFHNNTAPLYAFCPPALSNTISSWSQYSSLKYVSFPEQAIFKSSKIIAVMAMGKALQNKVYPCGQYVEALFITIGVAVFSIASKDPDRDSHSETIGLVFLTMYIVSDSFTAQYQDRIYNTYGRPNVDPYQMMLGVNISAIAMTTAGLVFGGDLPIIWEFLLVNPRALLYNLLTAITSASGQICIFTTIQLFGPIVFTIMMTVRQMLSICLSSVVFGHSFSTQGIFGGVLVFAVIFYQIRRKYMATLEKKRQEQQQQTDEEVEEEDNVKVAELPKPSSRPSPTKKRISDV